MSAILLICLLVIIFVITFKHIISKKGYKLIVSELFWIIFPWSICFILYFWGGITYTFNLSFGSVFYILAFWGCFMLGRYIKIKKDKAKNIDEKPKPDYEKKINLLPLFFISLVSVIIYTVSIILTNDINFGVTRNINTGAINTFFLFLSNASLIIWLYELAYSLVNDKKMPLFAYVSFFIYSVPALLISGRDAIMLIAISTVITFLYAGNFAINELNKEGKTFKKLIKLISIAFVIILFYFVFLSSNRYGNYMIGLFEWSAGARFSDDLIFISNNGGTVGSFFLNGLYYYSSQLSKLSFVIDNYDGPYLGGLFQFHYISRRLPMDWNLNYTMVTTAASNLANANGIPGLFNIWDTVIGYFIYDFGRIGSLVVSFICGYFIGKMRNKFENDKKITNMLYQIMICLAMFITVEYSPIFNTGWVFPICWLIFIDLFYTKLYKKVYEKLYRKLDVKKGTKIRMKLGTVIVTYNRLNLLKECIEACLKQTYSFEKIIVINNASTDGTEEYLNTLKHDNLMIINSEKNLGGAGGFYLGIKNAINQELDYLLLIDDDAIIDKNYNINIKKHMVENPEKVCAFSGTVMTNAQIQFEHRRHLKKNFCYYDSNKEEYLKEYFDYDLSTFCGLYIPLKLIKEIGLPCSEFFIWFDDTEYSLRLGKYGKIRNVNSAILNHKTSINDNSGYNWKSYYGIRNQVVIIKKYFSGMTLIKYILKAYIIILGGILLSTLKRDKYYSEISKMYKSAIKDGLNNNLGINANYVPGIKFKKK